MVISPVSQGQVATGLSVAFPPGTYGRVAPRSGLTIKHRINVGAGVIDPDYRGEVIVVLENMGTEPFRISVGDRIAQLVVEKCSSCQLEVVDTLDDTTRQDGGFGSTGTACPAVPPAPFRVPRFMVPASWKGINRVFIEYCTRPDSSLGNKTTHTKGC